MTGGCSPAGDGRPWLTVVVRCPPPARGPDVAHRPSARLGVARSRPVADACGAPVLRDQRPDRPAGHGKAEQGLSRCPPPCQGPNARSAPIRERADQRRCFDGFGSEDPVPVSKTEQERNGEPAEPPAQRLRPDQVEQDEAEQRVRLAGRLAGCPAPRAHPTPPSRVHRQRDARVRSASWVLGAWSSGAHARSAGGLLVLATWGEHGFRSTRNGRGRGRRPKEFIELATGEMMPSEPFSDPRRRTGRVLAATRQRNRPVHVLVQVSKTRRAEREVDPRSVGSR